MEPQSKPNESAIADVGQCSPNISNPGHVGLSVGDKLSIVNALMAQDRIEIRERQEAVFKLTYYVLPGLLGIAAFCGSAFA
jgi:hypothetical protein